MRMAQLGKSLSQSRLQPLLPEAEAAAAPDRVSKVERSGMQVCRLLKKAARARSCDHPAEADQLAERGASLKPEGAQSLAQCTPQHLSTLPPDQPDQKNTHHLSHCDLLRKNVKRKHTCETNACEGFGKKLETIIFEEVGSAIDVMGSLLSRPAIRELMNLPEWYDKIVT